jgi:hypothetical protein
MCAGVPWDEEKRIREEGLVRSGASESARNEIESLNLGTALGANKETCV